MWASVASSPVALVPTSAPAPSQGVGGLNAGGTVLMPVYRTEFITLGRVLGCGDRVCAILMSVTRLGCTRHTDPPVVDRGPAWHVRLAETKSDVIVQDCSSRGCRRRAGGL